MNIPCALMRFLLVPVSVFAGMISPYLGKKHVLIYFECSFLEHSRLQSRAVVGNRRPASNNIWPAPAARLLIAAGSEIDWSWQQQLLTIRVGERSGVNLTGARASWFSLAPRALHHEYNSCQRPVI